MLVFISPRFVLSDACNKEVNLADLLRLPIIPVMIEKTPWPPPGSLAMILSQHIYIDLAGTGGHGGCGRDADWSMKMRELIRRLKLYMNPTTSAKQNVINEKPNSAKPVFEVVEAMESAAPVGAAPPLQDNTTASIEDNVTISFDTEDVHEVQSWNGGHVDQGRVPCCVNALSFPSICVIL